MKTPNIGKYSDIIDDIIQCGLTTEEKIKIIESIAKHFNMSADEFINIFGYSLKNGEID